MASTRALERRRHLLAVLLAVTAISCGGKSGDRESAAGGACENAEEPLYPELPSVVGCYVHEPEGWRQIPCNCELWVKNTLPTSAEVRVTLAVVSNQPEPPLDGTSEFEVAFDDPDAQWFDVWAAQAGETADFFVARDGSTTTVRPDAWTVTLNPVPLAGCRSRTGTAAMIGSPSEMLDMQAEVTNESSNESLRSSGTCTNPLRP